MTQPTTPSTADRIHELAHELDTLATDLTAPAATAGPSDKVRAAFGALADALGYSGAEAVETTEDSPAPTVGAITPTPVSLAPVAGATAPTETAAPGVQH
jgi:hypothetical protein